MGFDFQRELYRKMACRIINLVTKEKEKQRIAVAQKRESKLNWLLGRKGSWVFRVLTVRMLFSVGAETVSLKYIYIYARDEV
jgi:hypothetical protein